MFSKDQLVSPCPDYKTVYLFKIYTGISHTYLTTEQIIATVCVPIWFCPGHDGLNQKNLTYCQERSPAVFDLGQGCPL